MNLRRGSRKTWMIGLGGVLALLLAVQLADGNDIIDLPAWANVKGVDVPLIGDTDTLGCKLSSVDGEDLVEIRLSDGDKSTYPEFVHVWRNGNLIAEEDVDRPADNHFIVPGEKGVEQFYAISTIPDRDDRTFCASITPE